MQTPFKQHGRVTIGSASVALVRRRYPVAAQLSSAAATNASERSALNAQALRTFDGGGFGDAAIGTTAPHSVLDGIELQHQARGHRARSVSKIVASALGALAAGMRQLYTSWQRQQRVSATFRALSALDTRTLRDLGIDRSEILSLANAAAGHTGGSPLHFMSIRACGHRPLI